jgi:hypothetical protein
MIEELTERLEAVIVKNDQNEKIIAELRHQAN